MPDLSGLTDDQQAAMRELPLLLDMHMQAVERRIEAEAAEREARRRIVDLSYRVAGAT